jgi:hypothetical protein
VRQPFTHTLPKLVSRNVFQVGTSDGRVKLFGRAGVEATLHSSCGMAYATRALEFLPNRGVLVRCAEVGRDRWLAA